MISLRVFRFLVAAALAAGSASAVAGAADLDLALVLVAKPQLRDALYGSSVLLVRPVGRDQHLGFIVNRPTRTTLGELFPLDPPSRKVIDPVYLGGPHNTQVIFALVQRAESPGPEAIQVMPGLYAAFDAKTLDGVIRADPARARFVAGFVAWRAGELRREIEQGAWYVLEADASLALHRSDGLWEELVRRSQRLERSI